MARRPTRGGTRVALLVVSSLAACAYVDPDPTWADREARVVDASAFAPRRSELHRIDPPTSADRIEDGDRILYGVELTKGGATRHWLVEVTVDDAEFETGRTRSGGIRRTLRLAVRVCDGAGNEVGREMVTVSREDLVFGLFSVCRGDERPRAEDDATLPFGAIPPEITAKLALMNMLTVIRRSEVLFGVLWEVIDKPSFFSVVSNLGVRVSVHTQFDAAEERAPFPLAGDDLPVYELPVELRLNDVPALRTKILVTEPRSPLNLSAGILAIDAFQPSDPDARVSIRVIAARRIE